MRAHTIATQAWVGGRGRIRRGIVPGGILALSLAVVLLAPTATSRAEDTSPGGLYVALGDSVAAPAGSYVDHLFPHYQSTLGVTELSNRAVGGETSGSIRTGTQLPRALADINADSDTRAVTIDIGGNDRFECAGRWDSCAFRDNFSATLSDLGAALDSDPGPESFAAMAYYNPASGTEGEGQYPGLLGTDQVIDCEITAGPEVGINDIIYQEALRREAFVADPYLAFRAGGQSFMADSIHPNDAGQAAIADAFREASAVCPEAGTFPPPSPVDDLPPDLQLSGDKTQNPQADKICDRGLCDVKVKVSCGDEACTAHAKGKLTKVSNDKLMRDGPRVIASGTTPNLGPEIRHESQRKQVRKALDKGEKVEAKVTVRATDAAGNVATTKRTIRLVK